MSTFPPNSAFGKICHNYKKERKLRLKQELPPSSLQRALTGWMLKSKDIARDMPEMLTTEGLLSFWKRNLKRFRTSEEDISAKIEALAQYHTDIVYKKDAFASLKCPVLVLETERMEAFGKTSFEELKDFFPNADIHQFKKYGNMVVLAKGGLFGKVVMDWLTSKYWAENEVM